MQTDEDSNDVQSHNFVDEEDLFSQIIEEDSSFADDSFSIPSTSEVQTPKTNAAHNKPSTSMKRKKESKEDILISKCIETIMAPPPQPKEKALKSRSMAFIDSLSALLSEMEKEEPRLAMDFTKSLRKTYNEFADRFDDLKMNKLQ